MYETYWGDVEAGVRSRQTANKILVAVVVEQVGRRGLGRIRMRLVPDASASSLRAFVENAIEPGTLVHRDGSMGYARLTKRGYRHRITFVRGQATPKPICCLFYRLTRQAVAVGPAPSPEGSQAD